MLKNIFTLLALIVPSINYANELWEDIQFYVINDSIYSINNPNANNPTDTNTKAIKSEHDKLKRYLSCSSDLLYKAYPPVSKADISKFDINALNLIKKNSMGNKYIPKAIYLNSLRLENITISGENMPTKEWQLDKKKEWCSENDSNNDQSLTIPLNLPSLEDGIEDLNKDAINYSWLIIEKHNTNQLKNSCDAAIVKFLERVGIKE